MIGKIPSASLRRAEALQLRTADRLPAPPDQQNPGASKEAVGALKIVLRSSRPCCKNSLGRQRYAKIRCHGFCHRRGKRVTHLLVGRSLAAIEVPIVWEALNTGNHAYGKPGHSDKVHIW